MEKWNGSNLEWNTPLRCGLAPLAQNKRTTPTHISHARRAKARREWAAVLAALRAQLGASTRVCYECERKREGR